MCVCIIEGGAESRVPPRKIRQISEITKLFTHFFISYTIIINLFLCFQFEIQNLILISNSTPTKLETKQCVLILFSSGYPPQFQTKTNNIYVCTFILLVEKKYITY